MSAIQNTSKTLQPRRTTAAALKQAASAFLSEALPPGWTIQTLVPGHAGLPGVDILVISPRGRCHFLFVRAPAERWWDGGLHCAAAEKITAREARLAQQLRAGGHRAHAIRGAQDLSRALKAWGCPLTRPVRLKCAARPEVPKSAWAKPPRPRLRLAAWRRQGDA